MTISKEEFEQLKSRTSVIEAALAYTITNLSATFTDIKPAVTSALIRDASLNESNNKNVADALRSLAGLINSFSVTDEKQ